MTMTKYCTLFINYEKINWLQFNSITKEDFYQNISPRKLRLVEKEKKHCSIFWDDTFFAQVFFSALSSCRLKHHQSPACHVCQIIVWLIYSQTWANDHLRIATTCLQRPLFCGPVFLVYSIKVPLNNDHLSTTATIFGSRGWPLYTGLTVHKWRHNLKKKLCYLLFKTLSSFR